MTERSIRLNGAEVTLTTDDPLSQLLYALREQAGQHGPKFGCGVSQCGACTVLVNDVPTRSCVSTVAALPTAPPAQVRTLDGLDPGHPLPQAFLDEQAAQCAFCINGMVMGSLAWLESRVAAGEKKVPTRSEVATHLSGDNAQTFTYLCRCGAHNRIIDAIRAAAKEMAR
ncbi:MAG: (2Fe-2S)-binding protein [Frankiales bacterium]|nr:(2Fe-2S)-binding protein [Frankiales bacterium]